MDLAKGRKIIEEANRQRVAELSIRSALRLLKPPKPRKKPDGPRRNKPKVHTGALNSLAWSDATPAAGAKFIDDIGHAVKPCKLSGCTCRIIRANAAPVYALLGRYRWVTGPFYDSYALCGPRQWRAGA